MFENTENDFNRELNEFNSLNEEVDNTIRELEDEQAEHYESIETPVKRTRRQVKLYKSIFNNKICAQIEETTEESKIEEVEFT